MKIVVIWMMVSTICAESVSSIDELEERIDDLEKRTFSKCASKSELQKLTDGVEKLANMVRYYSLIKIYNHSINSINHFLEIDQSCLQNTCNT